MCSQCGKNSAIIFINKLSQDGKNELEGLCYDCAKKRGINPLQEIAKQMNMGNDEENLDGISSQFEEMIKDISR